jgi:hypothetical protein
MAINIHRETARIYQFPVTPRRRLDNGKTVPAVGLEATLSVVDDCWYHEEALHEPVKPERPKPC